MINEIRRVQSDWKILLGGTHATYFEKECCDVADHVFSGRSEETLKHFVKPFYNDEILENVYKSSSISYQAHYVNYTDICKKYPYHYIPVESSFGCSNSCSFCSIINNSI